MAMTDPRDQSFIESPSAVSVEDDGHMFRFFFISNLEPQPLLV